MLGNILTMVFASFFMTVIGIFLFNTEVKYELSLDGITSTVVDYCELESGITTYTTNDKTYKIKTTIDHKCTRNIK